MTIRVEREALLRVISRAPSSNQQQQQQQGPLIQQKQQSQDDEFVIVELPEDKLKDGSFFYDDDCIPTDNDDDQASVCSLSTGSYSSSSSSSTVDRRVSFAPTLITDVWTREKTLPQDVPSLYYSAQETQTVRNSSPVSFVFVCCSLRDQTSLS
jgi:hypothetical protein